MGGLDGRGHSILLAMPTMTDALRCGCRHSPGMKMAGQSPQGRERWTALLAFGHSALRWLTLMVCGALTSLAPRTVLAEAGRAVLVLSERGSDAEPLDTDLLGALRGQLRELDVAVLVVRAAREPLAIAAHRAKQIAARDHALGVIWLEVTPNQLSVFVYDASGHLYAREVEPDGSTASQSEALAIILRSAVAAMLEGEAVSMNEIQLPPPVVPAEKAPLPRRPPPPRSASSLRAGASYVGSIFARRTNWQHGAALSVRLRPTTWPWFFGADYTQFTAVELEQAGTEIELRRHPGELFGGVELPVSALRLDVLGAFSADYVQRTTTQVSEGFVATPDSSRWLLAISTRLGLSVPLSSRVFGVLALGADFLLNPFSQVVQPSSENGEMLGSPLRARPRVELGLLISAW